MVIKPEMIAIPEADFLMGCDNGRADERPAHRVLVKAFAIARAATTNDFYGRFLEDTGHAPPPAWANPLFRQSERPVTSVSWFDAAAYCDWLSSRTSKAYRLPTEAEWERAARGGLDSALYTWGDEPPESQPHYHELWRNGPEPAGQRLTNGFGLYDISENVHEWCSDWYDAGYYSRTVYQNPTGPDSGSRKASRGGSWRHQIKIARVSARSSIPPEFRYDDYGFRVALTP
ncbi:MAG TPA: SUMF1/EgtB/PvdO family nonheme iron enzyme [Blastocatellia bacterium]